MFRLLSIALVVAVCDASMGGAAWASIIQLSPVDDRNINDLDNNSVADTLGPQGDPFLRVFGVSGPSAAFRAAMEFDVSGIPRGAVVNSAVVGLHDRGSTFNPPFTISLYGFIGDGLISVADGNAITPFNFINSYSNVGNTGNPDYLIDVTSFVQFFVDANQPFAGILLRSSGEGGLFRGNDLASSENGDLSARPGLTVDYTPVPEPGSLLLLGAGGSALLARRWHGPRPTRGSRPA